jgi:hypothetical protein
MLRGEATNTNFIVFGLTRSRLEPTIYHTSGKHANHYTTCAIETEEGDPSDEHSNVRTCTWDKQRKKHTFLSKYKQCWTSQYPCIKTKTGQQLFLLRAMQNLFIEYKGFGDVKTHVANQKSKSILFSGTFSKLSHSYGFLFLGNKFDAEDFICFYKWTFNFKLHLGNTSKNLQIATRSPAPSPNILRNSVQKMLIRMPHCMIRTISVFKRLCVTYRCEMNIKKNVWILIH